MPEETLVVLITVVDSELSDFNGEVLLEYREREKYTCKIEKKIKNLHKEGKDRVS